MHKRAEYRHISIIILVAFLTNLLLPFLAVYPSSSLSPASKISPAQTKFFGGKILLCTTDGLKWVSISELQQKHNSSDNPTHDKKLQCALCFLQAQGIKLSTLESNNLAALSIQATKSKLNIPQSHSIPSSLVHSAFARAPPPFPRLYSS